MSVVLNHLVGKKLLSTTRREFDSLVTFDDQSTIIAYAPCGWVCGQHFIPIEFGLEKILQSGCGKGHGSFRVTGITFFVDSLALRVHFNDRWALEISPEDPLIVSWVLCLASDRIVTAGGGGISVYGKM
jgi:hypothetical protein